MNRPYSRCQSLKRSLVFLNRASYGRRRNNYVTSQEREVTMMLRHNLRTDAHICGKSATQASLFVRHGRGVNRVYYIKFVFSDYGRSRVISLSEHCHYSEVWWNKCLVCYVTFFLCYLQLICKKSVIMELLFYMRYNYDSIDNNYQTVYRWSRAQTV